MRVVALVEAMIGAVCSCLLSPWVVPVSLVHSLLSQFYTVMLFTTKQR